MQNAPVFNEIYQKYLAEVSAINLGRVSCRLALHRRFIFILNELRV